VLLIIFYYCVAKLFSGAGANKLWFTCVRNNVYKVNAHKF